jgi:hypothetical protein
LTLLYQNDLAGARAELVEALRISEAALGLEHPNVALIRANLGVALEALGDRAGARSQLQEALRVIEASLDPRHPGVRIARQNLDAVIERLDLPRQ